MMKYNDEKKIKTEKREIDVMKRKMCKKGSSFCSDFLQIFHKNSKVDGIIRFLKKINIFIIEPH